MDPVFAPILLTGYFGADPLDSAGRVIKVHADLIGACKAAQPGARIFILQGSLAELIEAGLILEVME